jgi:hypothetical protein
MSRLWKTEKVLELFTHKLCLSKYDERCGGINLKRLAFIIAISIFLILGCGGTVTKQKTETVKSDQTVKVVDLNRQLVEQAKNVTTSGQRIPFNNDIDVASVAYGSLQHVINAYPDYQQNLSDIMPGMPLFVKSYDKEIPNYYIVPFTKDDLVLGSVIVMAYGNEAVFSSAGYYQNPQPDVLLVDSKKAKEILSTTKGIEKLPSPSLVFQQSELSLGPGSPFCEFDFSDNTKLYVTQQGKVYDSIIPYSKKLRG